ncbi:MAG: hypothetical protein RL571_1373 [Pseudomonadota bacterium]|jgi:hypothetical protein
MINLNVEEIAIVAGGGEVINGTSDLNKFGPQYIVVNGLNFWRQTKLDGTVFYF